MGEVLGLATYVFGIPMYSLWCLVKQLQPYYFPLYNMLDFRLTLILIVLLLLGGASHAERGTAGSSDTAIFVGVILVLIVLAGVAVHAIVVDILQIVRTRKLEYSTDSDRRAQMAAYLEKE